MSVSIRPDPDDQFIIINVDGELVSVANLQQDVEFTVTSSSGWPVKSGKSTESLKKALGELRLINDLDALEELLHQIETWLQAKQKATFAARHRDNGLQIADLNLEDDLSPGEEELEWVAPDQAAIMIKPLKP